MRQVAEAGAAARGRIIERPRLLHLLDAAAARTILLIAPAGYGKTTLARQWTEGKEDVYWYTARPGSADVAQLAVGLAQTFAPAAEGLEAYVSELVRSLPNPAAAATDVAEAFAKAIPTAASSRLVLDDHHLLQPTSAAEIFVRAFQEHARLRLMVIARQRPTWPFARLQVYGELLELGIDDLALNPDEAAQLLDRPPSECKQLLDLARGWPAVIALATLTDGHGLPGSPDDADTLFRFLAEEVFQTITPDMRELLPTLALLPNLSAAAIRRFTSVDPSSVMDEAVASGLVTRGRDGAELHPLAREYLLSKLPGVPDAARRVQAAFDLSLEQGMWDNALTLLDRFDLHDRLPALIETSFMPLVASARIATLRTILSEVDASGRPRSPQVDLIDAELAFRDAAFSRAETTAVRAAEALPAAAPSLASHAWWLAGEAAHLSFRDTHAVRYFRRAEDTAEAEGDLRDALWGLAMTLAQTEARGALKILKQLMVRDSSHADLVRGTTASLLLHRLRPENRDIDPDAGLHSLPYVNPTMRASFLNAWAYHLIMRGRYPAAAVAAGDFRAEAERYHLNWALPHADWALAAAELGQRQFKAANTSLRRVEKFAANTKSGQLLLNAGCLRARLLLALHKPEDALAALLLDSSWPANKAMHAEYLAIRALIAAILERHLEAGQLALEATHLSRCVEAHAYAACASAVIHLSQGMRENATLALAGVVRLGAWDALVSAVRAQPDLVECLDIDRYGAGTVARVFTDSNDYDLARRAGLNLQSMRRSARGAFGLSPREREVLGLVRQGLTNKAAARVLFISPATVKVHMRHVLEKTGARSRAEAIAITADLD